MALSIKTAEAGELAHSLAHLNASVSLGTRRSLNNLHRARQHHAVAVSR
jgi:hypothetical protein